MTEKFLTEIVCQSLLNLSMKLTLTNYLCSGVFQFLYAHYQITRIIIKMGRVTLYSSPFSLESDILNNRFYAIVCIFLLQHFLNNFERTSRSNGALLGSKIVGRVC